MIRKKNVLLVTFHDWESNRLAGFHFIAKSFLLKGYNVGFCSHKRPLLHAVFNINKIHNIKNWIKLFFGKRYLVEDNEVLNFTGLDLTIPNKISAFLNLNSFLQVISDKLLVLRCKKLFPDPQFIIIESGSSILSYKWFKKKYKDAAFIYRPSDPCIGGRFNNMILEREKALYFESDIVLLVNKESLELYNKFSFENKNGNVIILPNAIDLKIFHAKYDCPQELKKEPSICYVGGHPPDFRLIFKLALAEPELNILIICPERLTANHALQLLEHDNISYIEGVSPRNVPKFLSNASIIMIPYQDEWKKKPLGMHGKIMQAMACKKPIVCKNVSKDLTNFGIRVCHNDDEFISSVQKIIAEKDFNVDYNYRPNDWDNFCLKVQKILDL